MVNTHLFQVGLEVLGLIVQVLDVFETLACLLIQARQHHRFLPKIEQPEYVQFFSRVR